ncbi:MAG: InlB B-repeat-containing protein [Clostridia bacterium]|nr:InlB B-repeat-containing protein [Clostridia bacterium]
MKRQRKVLIAVLTFICVMCTVFAFGCAQKSTYYTVTFMDGETQIGQPLKVKKGAKIAEYPPVTHEDEYDYLDGWCMDDGLTKVWNKDIERVTKDITLYAKFLHITEAPGNAQMDGVAFSNTLTWLQRGVEEGAKYSVKLFESQKISRTDYEYAEQECYSEENCEVTVKHYKDEPDIYMVKWTASVKPLGGVYGAEVTSGDDAVMFGKLLYKGAGTEENPYLIDDATDFAAINTADVPQDSYYKMLSSVVVRAASSKVAGFTFDGRLDGNGKTVTIEASDCGLFDTLGEHAEIYDLAVSGSVPGVSGNCAGVIAAVNNGSINYCNVSATITSELGTIGSLEVLERGIVGGVGGFAGINNGEISNCAFTGTAQASVGAGGIAAVNYGKITSCTNGGTLGAGNSNETGTSTRKYSYMGGIVAVNYGTVSSCATTNSGKLLAQRSESGESPNNNLGGIAAYNAAGATITECWFDGIRVHGNKNVGGIAGENAGSISYCFAAAIYKSGSGQHSYVGGYANVGGIAGLTSGEGKVENCFVTANVFAYGGAAYSLAEKCENGVYIGGNLDVKDGEQPVIAPEGNGNTLVEVTDEDRTQYATKNYVLTLTEEQLTALNGVAEDGKFAGTTVRLTCEGFKTVQEHTIRVTLHGLNTVYDIKNTSSDSLPLSKLNAPAAEEGYYLAGWAMKEGGEIVLGTKAVGFADLDELGLETINLYPVYAEGEDPMDKVLDLAVYSRYVNEDMVKELIAAFQTYCTENGIEVNEFKYSMLGGSSTSVSAFCTLVTRGDYNVMFGQKENLTIEVIGNKDTLLTVNGSVRKIAKISEGTAANAFYDFVLNNNAAKKILYPGYISAEEASSIEITLMNGNEQFGEKITVTNATDAKGEKLNAPTPAEGFTFVGWAFTAEETENETLLSGTVTYADVENHATDGKVSLYARFSEMVIVRVGYYTNSKNVVSTTDMDKIKQEFEKLYDNVKVEFKDFTFSSSKNPITKMVTTINEANSDEDKTNNIDYLINFPSAGTILTGLNYKVSAQVGNYNKYIVQVTDNEYSAAFHEFALTNTTIAALPQTA